MCSKNDDDDFEQIKSNMTYRFRRHCERFSYVCNERSVEVFRENLIDNVVVIVEESFIHRML